MPRNPICLTLAAALSVASSVALPVASSGGRASIAGLATSAPQMSPVDLLAQTGPEPAVMPPRRRFGWPLPGSPSVVRGFHPPPFRYGPGHRGVDLAAAANEPVLAAGAGTVVFAGVVAGRGVVSVSHLGGLHTTYEPVSATVTAGQLVSRGEQIATVAPGHLGCPVAVCLHWGAFRDSGSAGAEGTDPEEPGRQYLDPLRLLAATRVRLLPIEALPDRS